MLLTITKRLKIYIDILILSRTLYMDIYVEVRWGLKRCLEVGVGRVGSRGRTLIRDPRVTTNKQVLKRRTTCFIKFYFSLRIFAVYQCRKIGVTTAAWL